MKTPLTRTLSCLALLTGGLAAQTTGFTNFIRQVQAPSGVQLDVSVGATGAQQSSLAVESGGARFELWTVKSSPLTNYLLDTKFVGAYIPVTSVDIRSEDPYTTIPRTRADRPFWVDLTVSGLTDVVSAPDAAKKIQLLRHVQSYGTTGIGLNLDRSQATLLSTSYLTTNGAQTLSYTLTSVPGTDRSKLRGEERFSAFSLPDTLSPQSQLASKYIQIWPVATGEIAGITEGQLIRTKMPSLTCNVTDVYPSGTIYTQVYQGNPVLGTVGDRPSAQWRNSENYPQNKTITLSSDDLDSPLRGDGTWTLELLTETPFGIDRLAKVTFTLKRSIKVNAAVTTME